MDAGREFQLRRVIHEQGREYIGNFGELKYLLAPYVVRNPSQQRRFYDLWDDYLAELEAEIAEQRAAEQSEEEEKAKRSSWKDFLPLLLILAGLVYFGPILIRNFFPNVVSDPVRVTAQPILSIAREGDSVHFMNTTKILKPEDSIAFNWLVIDVSTDSLMYSSRTFDLHYRVPEGTGRDVRVILDGSDAASHDSLSLYSYLTTVYCAEPPDLNTARFPTGNIVTQRPYEFSVFAEPNTDYYLVIAGDTLEFDQRVAEETSRAANFEAGSNVRLVNQHAFAAEGNYLVEIKAARRDDPDFCFSNRIENIQVGENLPILPPMALRADTPSQILEVNSWMYFLLILFGFFLIGFYRDRWQKRTTAAEDDLPPPKTEEELAAAYPIFDQGPYNIPYRDRSGQISVPSDFFRIADQLRFREEGERRTFDGRATVEATIQEGGFPQWRDRAARRPADYLALITHTDEFNQRDRLLRRLTDFLIDREASLTVYYHSGAFDHFWNEERPQGYSPAQLQSRYYDHRLLILGNAHGLVDPYESRQPRLIPARLKWMMGWNRRLILTTEPTVDWSFQEVLLHRQFLLFPFTTNGILLGLEHLNQTEEYQPGIYARWEAEMQRLHPEPSYRYRKWETLEDHREYLGDDDLFRWLCALAVATRPDWNLTIALGRALGIEVTHDGLLLLSRIPWLAENRPDPDLRLAFLGALSPADETAAREAMVRELAAAEKDTAKSFAATDWTTETSIQAFLLEPTDPGNQQKIVELQRVGWLSGNQLLELDDKAAKLNAEREANLGGLSQMTKGGSPPAKLEPTSEDGVPNLTAFLEYEAPEEEKAPEPWLNRRRIEALGFTLLFLLVFWPAYRYDQQQNELLGGEEPAWWQQSSIVDDRALELNNRAVGVWTRTEALENDTARRSRLDSLTLATESLAEAIELRDSDYPLADSNRTALQYNINTLHLPWFYRLINDMPSASEVDPLQRQEGIQQLSGGGGSGLAETFGKAPLETVETIFDLLREPLETELAASPPGNQFNHTAHLLGILHLGKYLSYLRYYGDGDTIRQSAIEDYESAKSYYQGIDEATSGVYFDSLSLIAPVNLRTLIIENTPDTTLRNELRDEIGIVDEDELASISDYVLRGRVVSPSGNPISGISVIISPYGPVTEYTGSDGVFRFPDAQAEETYRIEVFVPDLDSKTLTYRYDRREGNLGDIVWAAAGADAELEEANVKRIADLLARFSSARGNYSLLQVGSPKEAGRLQGYISGYLSGRSSEVVYSASSMLQNIDAQFENAQFEVPEISDDGLLFFGRAKHPEQLSAQLDALRAGSEALVISIGDFDDPQIPDISGMNQKTREFVGELNNAGFRTQHLENPTLRAFRVAIARYIARKRTRNTQSILYITGYLADQSILMSDAALLGQGPLGLTENDLLDYLNQIRDNNHQLVVLNMIDFDEVEEPSAATKAPYPEMVNVLSNTFEMGDTFDEGSRDEKPVHSVTVPFIQMGKYEVTFNEYDAFCAATGHERASDNNFGRGRRPVINVTWYEAVSYCNWLSTQHGYEPVYRINNAKLNSQWKSSDYGQDINRSGEEIVADWSANGYRLPTEAEWEYAASYIRGGKTGDGKSGPVEDINKARFGNGENRLNPTNANFNPNNETRYSIRGEYRRRTVEVGGLNSVNSYGLHDMAGNVDEWCWDKYGPYSNDYVSSPRGPNSGRTHVTRGGSWYDSAEACRAASRHSYYPYDRNSYLGFRLVRKQ